MELVLWARDLAERLLAEPLPRRWAHTQGVARQARTLAPILGDDADLLEAAAWLHDIGYAPTLVVTGFHPLDGARYLRNTEHADERLCRLVAHHTCALVEADERGIADELSEEFAAENPALTDALIYCDVTTSPDGERIEADERLAEIANRYGDGHVVSTSISRATPSLLAAVKRTQDRLAAQAS